jgi:hypothetical protein
VGWFSRKSPPKEPVYSSFGSRLYQLLDEREREWMVSGGWESYDYCHHTKSNLTVEWHRQVELPVNVRTGSEGSPSLSDLLTDDDKTIILRRAKKLVADRRMEMKATAMADALNSITPNPFDSTARQLAHCVLSGDTSAARPLIDRCIELIGEGY